MGQITSMSGSKRYSYDACITQAVRWWVIEDNFAAYDLPAAESIQ